MFFFNIIFKHILQSYVNRNRYIDHFREFFFLHKWGVDSCENALNSTAIKKVLQMRPRFDVIILEQFTTDCLMAVAHQLQVPVIGASSCALMPWHYARTGNPQITSYIPALFLGHSDNMSFGQRVANWVTVQGMILLKR